MFPCPWCKKTLPELVRRCPSCQADLSLVFDYVVGLEGGLSRAEQMTRQGRLDEAVWAYLEVLDVDPENPEAKRQIGRVAAAVRNFDSRPHRREAEEGWGKGIWLVIVLAALLLGVAVGIQVERWRTPSTENTSTEMNEGE
jgi:hypothetical protein